MAAQKASVVNLFNYTTAPTLIGGLQKSNSLSLIKDSYSGKYYGSSSYSELISSIQDARSYYQSQLSKSSTPVFGVSNTSRIGGSIRDTTDYLGKAKQALSTLESFKIPSKTEYVQKPQMVESFNADPDGWNKYFESSYKNPRIAEANNSMSQRNSQESSTTGATGNQLIASNLEIRKEVGTGIGKESSGLNPFGKLDVGLNI